jgi:hypothetical protein
MPKHLYLIFIATFFFGFVTGVFVYLINNTGDARDTVVEEPSKKLVITAHVYGMCEGIQACPSYRIEHDGSYTYIQRGGENGERRYDDVLTQNQFNLLEEKISSTDFVAVTQTVFKGMCPIVADGPAFRYDVEYEGARYQFDSCKEELDSVSLFETLQGYFEVFDIMYSPQS